MASTLCATFVFKRIYCVPPPASPMDRVADTMAVDAGECDTEIASDFCLICDTPEFSSSGPEWCPICDTPEFPTTPSSGMDAPIRTGQGHQVDDLWSPSTDTPDYEHSFDIPPSCPLRPTEAFQVHWCDVQISDGSQSTRYEKDSGMVTVMKGPHHAAQYTYL